MTQQVTSMIHVPDVPSTIAWYESVGFTVVDTAEDGGAVNGALLEFGTGLVMLRSGGQPRNAARREVDLYIHTTDVDDIYARLKGKVTVQEEQHDKFYGMRELI